MALLDNIRVQSMHKQVLTGIPLGILGELVELSRVSVESHLGSGAARWWVRVMETEVLSVRRV